MARLGRADSGPAQRCRRVGPRGACGSAGAKARDPGTLTLAGLRIGELIDLRWRDVDLATGRITVRSAKTDANVRTIDLLPILRDELAAHKANAKPGSSERIFPTLAGGPMNPRRPQPHPR